MENVSPFERLAEAKQSLNAASRAMKGIELKNKIDNLKESYSKTLKNGVSTSNNGGTSPGFRAAQKPSASSGDENTDEMLNRIGLAVQRKGNY